MRLPRLAAEWEPQGLVQITFPHADTDWAESLNEVIPCFLKLIGILSRYVRVLVVVADEREYAKLFHNIPSSSLILHECISNDSWARDHAAITIEGLNGPKLLDFEFNGWGNKFAADLDNQINQSLYKQGIFGQVDFETLSFVLEGGSIESDGQGTILTTSECLLSPERNPQLSKDQIEKALYEYLGAQRVLWLDHGSLEGDDTDAHIDTLARFCSADTIAYVKCDDPMDSHYEDLKRMEQQLLGFRQINGTPYHLVPLPWPDACYAKDGHRLPATYANFLITNGAVVVPTYGLPQDDKALQILEGTFPEREITAVNCRSLIEQHGSLHCVTMHYPASLFKND